MHEMISNTPPPPQPPAGTLAAQLSNRLRIAHSHHCVKLRIEDVRKNVEAMVNSLEGLKEQCTVITEQQLMMFQESMNANTKNMEQMMKSNECAHVLPGRALGRAIASYCEPVRGCHCTARWMAVVPPPPTTAGVPGPACK